MPLEATILCLDTSGYMVNGDYTPTRIDAQYDAATMLCGAKIDANPESTVGVLTAGGKGCVPCGRRDTRGAVWRCRAMRRGRRLARPAASAARSRSQDGDRSSSPRPARPAA